MRPTIDEATSQFVQTAAADLQRQLSVAGRIEKLSIETGPKVTTLIAMIRVADRLLEVAGHGDSLVTAYGDLRRQVAVPTLVAAYRSVLDRGA